MIKTIKSETFPFVLNPLPYGEGGLSPHISAKTLSIHHGKHHNTYIQQLNKLISETEFKNLTLEEIILLSKKDKRNVGIFNAAAQTWNHSFFWHSMALNKTNLTSKNLIDCISRDFGGYEQFIRTFKSMGLLHFGSGWIWLVICKKNKILKILNTKNADTPLTEELVPLITCDVWEHAYYLDYQNDRSAYLDAFLKNLINWNFAEGIFESVIQQ